jgi:cathepsin L
LRHWWEIFEVLFNSYEFRAQPAKINESLEVPESIDWRSLGALNDVQDQNKGRNCGSCYAFASLAVLESHHFIRKGKLLKLSEQEIVDCSYGNDGCFGGQEGLTYNYIIKNGISLAEDYPYRSVEGKCRKNSVERSEVKVFGFAELRNQTNLKTAIAQHGPVIIPLNLLTETFRFYKEGILEDRDVTYGDTNHAVVVVGYGNDEETGLDYWIIRNSFSKAWGENGYMRIGMHEKTFFEPFFGYYPLLVESAADDNKKTNIKVSFVVVCVALVVGLSLVLGLCCCLIGWLRRRCYQ